MKKLVSRLSALFGLAAVAPLSFATEGGGVDYSALTSGIDFTSATAAIMTVAGLLMVVLGARKGARLVMGMIGR